MEEMMSQTISLIQSNETGINIIVTIIVAVVFGDMAAVYATRRFQKKEAKRARLTALQSLVNEVERIQKVVDHNRQLESIAKIQSVTRMPVAAFETAFVSGERGLSVSKKLLQAVTDYLACADSINSLVDIYPSSITNLKTELDRTDDIIQQIVEASEHKLPENLERLRTYLREEIERGYGLSILLTRWCMNCTG